MKDWNEVMAYLRAHCLLDAVAAGWAALSWRFTGDDGVPLIQHQTVRLGQASGEPYLIVASEVATRMSPEQALRHNSSLAIGALALEEDRCLLRHGLFLRDAGPPRLGRALAMVAHEAARLGYRARVPFAPEFYEPYCD